MKRKIALLGAIIALLTGTSGFAQQPVPTSESSKYRAIFTIGGAGGGFVLGLGAGLAVFDDAVNSNRKVWTTALLAGLGGGVGGYFLGRALDKHRAKISWRYAPDPLDLKLAQYRSAAVRETRGDEGNSNLSTLVPPVLYGSLVEEK